MVSLCPLEEPKVRFVMVFVLDLEEVIATSKIDTS